MLERAAAEAVGAVDAVEVAVTAEFDVATEDDVEASGPVALDLFDEALPKAKETVATTTTSATGMAIFTHIGQLGPRATGDLPTIGEVALGVAAG